MQPGAESLPFDVLLIGSGLGALAAARGLAGDGRRVGIITGVGRSRSLESDGGLVDPRLVDKAFGRGAPLGQIVSRRQGTSAASVDDAPVPGPVEEMEPHRAYRRLELETWARNRVIEAGLIYLEDFIEGAVLPLQSGLMTVTDEAGTRSLTARTVVLCEGSDPRIAMRAGLRPDYPPEEQIHFARTIIAQPQAESVYLSGRIRTSWGMPIGVAIVPLGATTLVGTDTRIENVMRGSRSTQEALLDFLSSRMAEALGLRGDRIHTGIELTAMRSNAKGLRLSQDQLLMGIDASGMMDARELRRADATILAGLHLASYISGPREQSWDAFAMPLVEQLKSPEPRWHDSRATGFIEESDGRASVMDSISRVGKGVLGRLRRRE